MGDGAVLAVSDGPDGCVEGWRGQLPVSPGCCRSKGAGARRRWRDSAWDQGPSAWIASSVSCRIEAWRKPAGGRRISRRAVRTIRSGMQKSRLRSALAWRRWGRVSGPTDAPAAGQRSQQKAVRLTAASAAVIHTRLACSSPEGRWRSAWPSFESFRRSSIWARWRWKCSIHVVGAQWMSVSMKL